MAGHPLRAGATGMSSSSSTAYFSLVRQNSGGGHSTHNNTNILSSSPPNSIPGAPLSTGSNSSGPFNGGISNQGLQIAIPGSAPNSTNTGKRLGWVIFVIYRYILL